MRQKLKDQNVVRSKSKEKCVTERLSSTKIIMEIVKSQNFMHLLPKIKKIKGWKRKTIKWNKIQILNQVLQVFTRIVKKQWTSSKDQLKT